MPNVDKAPVQIQVRLGTLRRPEEDPSSLLVVRPEEPYMERRETRSSVLLVDYYWLDKLERWSYAVWSQIYRVFIIT